MINKGLLFSNDLDHALFCGFGILVSVYALYVETRKHKDSRYKAACDLGENMSCSRVLTSRLANSKYFMVVLSTILMYCVHIKVLLLQSLLLSVKMYCCTPILDSKTIA